jgi:hypothetical protein
MPQTPQTPGIPKGGRNTKLPPGVTLSALGPYLRHRILRATGAAGTTRVTGSEKQAKLRPASHPEQIMNRERDRETLPPVSAIPRVPLRIPIHRKPDQWCRNWGAIRFRPHG